MAQRESRWKWLFVGLLIAVTLIGASLGILWKIEGVQKNFNQKVLANAVSTNTQIRALQEENADLTEDMDTVMQAINDLEAWITEDQERQNRAIMDLQEQITNLEDRLDSTNSRISSLWDYYYALEDRVSILECDLYADNNCTAPDTCCQQQPDRCTSCGSCGSCGSCCGYCGYCGRYYN